VDGSPQGARPAQRGSMRQHDSPTWRSQGTPSRRRRSPDQTLTAPGRHSSEWIPATKENDMSMNLFHSFFAVVLLGVTATASAAGRRPRLQPKHTEQRLRWIRVRGRVRFGRRVGEFPLRRRR
ncbi:hypothetical protein LN457_18075, partial [Xanthomonas phaseoli]|uniref:hypothetical protein n=1 Tax=Xanthomonas phaseoli TaxID=1985254 RepID=UPI001E417EC4